MKNYRKTGLLFLVAAMLNFSATKASEGIEDPKFPVKLICKGSIDKQPLYQLSLENNTSDNSFLVSIYDEDGTTLYSEILKSENLEKSFLLDSYDLGDAVLTLEVKGRTTGNKVAYRISQHKDEVRELLAVK